MVRKPSHQEYLLLDCQLSPLLKLFQTLLAIAYKMAKEQHNNNSSSNNQIKPK